MDFEYKNLTCNIKNCNNPSNEYLICDVHREKYISDNKIDRIQILISKMYYNSISLKERSMIFLFNLIHYTTTYHIYFVEHFPLESLFLYHKKKLFTNYRTYMQTNDNILKDKILLDASELVKDFNFEENIFLNDILQLINKLCVNTQKVNYDSLDDLLIYSEIKAIIMNPKLFKYLLLISFLFYFVTKLFDIQLVYLFSIDFKYILLIAFLGLGWVNNGLKYIFSLDSLVTKAYHQKLYEDEKSNEEFIESYINLKKKVVKDSEFRASYIGSFVGTCVLPIYFFIKELISVQLSISCILLSIVVCLISIILFYSYYCTYPLMTSFSRFIDDIYPEKFLMQLYAPDKSFNVEEIKQTLLYNIIFNVIFAIIIWSIPVLLLLQLASYMNIFLYILAFLFSFYWALLRVRNIRLSSIIMRNLYYNFKKMKKTEISKLKDNPCFDSHKEYDFVSNLKFFNFSVVNFAKKHIQQLIYLLLGIIITLVFEKKIDISVYFEKLFI